MEEDRIRGGIATADQRKREAVAYARKVMPMMRQAIGATRKPNNDINMSAAARWLNEQTPPVSTFSGTGKFGAETVSRVIFKTEESVRSNAEYSCSLAVRLINQKAEEQGREPDAQEIARLEAERDAAIAEGVLLGRQLRCEDIAPIQAMTLEDAARLIILQVDHRKRGKGWDTNQRSFGDGVSFEAWVRDILLKTLNQSDQPEN